MAELQDAGEARRPVGVASPPSLEGRRSAASRTPRLARAGAIALAVDAAVALGSCRRRAWRRAPPGAEAAPIGLRRRIDLPMATCLSRRGGSASQTAFVGFLIGRGENAQPMSLGLTFSAAPSRIFGSMAIPPARVCSFTQTVSSSARIRGRARSLRGLDRRSSYPACAAMNRTSTLAASSSLWGETCSSKLTSEARLVGWRRKPSGRFPLTPAFDPG